MKEPAAHGDRTQKDGDARRKSERRKREEAKARARERGEREEAARREEKQRMLAAEQARDAERRSREAERKRDEDARRRAADARREERRKRLEEARLAREKAEQADKETAMLIDQIREIGQAKIPDIGEIFDAAEHGRPRRFSGLRPGILAHLPGSPPFEKQDPVEALKHDVPLTLLPIRLETIFADRGKRLKVRVYPDELHIDDHDPRVTADELAAGDAFWARLAAAGDDEAQIEAAKDWLAELLSERRAAYVAERTHPDAKDRPTPHARAGERPALARCLPRRWRFVGYARKADGTLEEVLRHEGADIPAALCMDPLRGDRTDEGAPAARSAAWMFDFSQAKKVGMGVEIDVSDLDCLPEPGLALLMVYGVGGPASRTRSAELQTLLTAHRFASGLAFQAQGVATNSVEDVTSPVAAHLGARDGSLDSVLRDPVSAGATNALRLAQALGVAPDPVLARIEGAERDEDAGQAWMNEALWPVTWGQYFGALMANRRGTSAIPKGAIAAAREAFLADVRAAGPLPAIRIGAQPYGVLPVRAHHVPTAWTSPEPWFEFLLLQLRNIWLAATPMVPKLDPGGNGTREQELSQVVSVLGGVPHPARLLVRSLHDWRTEAETNPWLDIGLALLGLAWLVADDPSYGYEAQSIMGQWGWARAMLGDGWEDVDGAGLSESILSALDERSLRSPDEQIARITALKDLVAAIVSSPKERETVEIWCDLMIRQVEMHRERLAPYLGGLPIGMMVDVKGVLRDGSLDPEIGFHLYGKTAREVTRPLVIGVPGAGGGAPTDLPSIYLEVIAASVPRDTRARDTLFQTPVPGGHRTVQGSGAGGTLLRRNLARRSGPMASIATVPGAFGASGGGGLSGAVSPGPVAAGPVDGDAPLLKQLVRAAADVVENGQRGGFKTALRGLADLPHATLEWHLRETLGLASNRLDAWLTALATRRMREMAKDRRAQYGGYGFVLGLRPGPASQTDGFVHAPSMQLATTGAILRSAWLGHGRGDEASPLAVNLASARLRDATRLFEGVSQGRSVGDMLGQDFERALHAAGDDIAIDPIRTGVLDAVARGQGRRAQPPRGPVDGVDLLDAFDAGDLDDALAALQPKARRDRVAAEIEARRALFDALGDAGLAEAVHSLAQGNAARAASVMDALSLGEAPPGELRHARTDIARSELQHTVLIALAPSPDRPASDEAGDVSDIGRGYSHPALQRYVARLMPPLGRLSITVMDGTQMYPVRLRDLGLSALDLVCEAARPGALGRWAMLHLVRVEGIQLTPEAHAISSLDADRAEGAVAPELEDFEELCSQLASHLGALRMPKPADFGLSEEAAGFGCEPALRAHLSRLLARIKNRLKSLDDALGRRDREALLSVLPSLACEGVPQALPVVGLMGRDNTAALVEHAEKVFAALRKTHERARGADRADAGAEALCAAIQILGDAMLVPEVPVLGVTVPADARRGFPAPPQSELLDWAGKYAHVRPDLTRWTTAADTARLVTGRPGWPLRVAQVARPRQDAWLATTLPEDTSPGGRSWVVADAGGVQALRRAKEAIVYVIDGWTERLPARNTTTGVAFHFDAPSSRPPQSILLATTPNREMRWSTELLERTLIETVENAQLRAVTNGELGRFGHHLPAIFVPGGIDAGPQPQKEETP